MPRCSTSVLAPRLAMCSRRTSVNQILMGWRVYRLGAHRASPGRTRVAKFAPMKLYTYYRSTAAFRVRIALNLKGVPCENISMHLRHGAHKTPDFLKLNPQGLIPALDDDG